MDIKGNYNSQESIKTYARKVGLTKTEDSIFKMFPNKKISILDLGCGGGRTTIDLLDKGYKNTIGVDFAEKLIEQARKNHQQYSDNFEVGDAVNLSNYKENQFDIVFFSYNGIDYIPSRKMRLKAYHEIQRVLKKGGYFIFSSHNRRCLPTNRNLLKTMLRNIFRIGGEYWNTQQSFGDIPTYYSTEKQLEKDLAFGFDKILVVPNNSFLYPFFDTFPYYIFLKK